MMNETRNDLSKDVRQKVIHLLSPCLLDAVDLQLQARQAHWTVRGATFMQLHELFDKAVGEAAEWADLLAERIAQLGGVPLGTARMVAAHSRLGEYDFKALSGAEHCRVLAGALSAFGAGVRKAIDASDELGDKVTSDVCTEVCRGADKLLWFVESHVER